MSKCDKPDLEEYSGQSPELESDDPTDDVVDGSSAPTPDPEPTVYGIDDILTEFCRVGGVHPQLLNGLFLNMIADHFSDPGFIWALSLKDKIFDPDPLKTNIQLFTITQFDPSDPPGTLSVVVKRGQQRFSRIGIGDTNGISVDGRSTIRKVEGSHTFLATGGTGAESEFLGWELSELFNSYSRLLVPNIFQDFQVANVGETGSVDEVGRLVGVPVIVTYEYTYEQTIRPVEPTLKRIDSRIDT